MSNNTNITRKFETTKIKAVLTQGARGKSTYEIWLEEGNTGTVQDFLNSTDRHYVHEQTVSLDTWTITHNLNKRPSVTVVDSGETVVIGSIEYVSDNEIIITFSASFAGKAYLN